MRGRLKSTLCALAVGASSAARAADAPATSFAPPGSFTDEYPALRRLLEREARSPLRFGVGLLPFGLTNSKLSVGVSLVQIYWIRSPWDLTLVDFSYSFSIANAAAAASRSALVRLSPKFQITESLAVGPMAGMDFTTFPDVSVRLNRGGNFTQPEPFTGVSLVYGAEISQTFGGRSGEDGGPVFRASQLVYQQKYSTAESSRGWRYRYADTPLNTDPSPVAPGLVLALQFSVLL